MQFEILCPYRILSNYLEYAPEAERNTANNAACQSCVNTLIHGHYSWDLEKQDKIIKFADLVIQLIAQTHAASAIQEQGLALLEHTIKQLTGLITSSSHWQQSRTHQCAVTNIFYYGLLISKTQQSSCTAKNTRLNQLNNMMSNLFILAIKNMVHSIHHTRELYFVIPSFLGTLEDNIGLDTALYQKLQNPVAPVHKSLLLLEYLYTSIEVLANAKVIAQLYISGNHTLFCPTTTDPQNYLINCLDTLYKYQFQAHYHKPFSLNKTRALITWQILYDYHANRSVLDYQVLKQRIAKLSQPECAAHLHVIIDVFKRLISLKEQQTIAISETESAIRFIQATTPLIRTYLNGCKEKATGFIYELINQCIVLDDHEITEALFENIYKFQQINAVVLILSELISSQVHKNSPRLHNHYVKSLIDRLKTMTVTDWNNARLNYPCTYQQTLNDIQIIEHLIPQSTSLIPVSNPELKRTINVYIASRKHRKSVNIDNGGSKHVPDNI